MTSKFVKVKCGKCKKEQVTFERPATTVKCIGCGEVLAVPLGGRGKFKSKTLTPVK